MGIRVRPITNVADELAYTAHDLDDGLRAGLITPAAYLGDINATARRYYTNALNGTPDREIAARKR